MNEAEFKLKKAIEFEEAGQLLHALQFYLPLLSNAKMKRTASMRIAGIYERLNNINSAVSIIQDYIDNNDEDIHVLRFYCHLLLRNELYDQALDVLSSLSAEDHPEVLFLSGLANFSISEYEIAKINFETFANENQGSDLLPDSYLYLSKINIRQNNLDKALTYAKKSQELLNQNYDVHLTLAIIYYLKEMYLHSYDSIQKAKRLNQDDPKLAEWTGKILFKLGEFEKAEQLLRNFISKTNSSSEVYSLLGLTCLKANKYDDAEEFFNMALKLNPKNEIAIEGLKKCEAGPIE